MNIQAADNLSSAVHAPANFDLQSEFAPAGDQPTAIKELIKGIKQDERDQVLLGVTGSGKTFTAAHVIQAVRRPTLILARTKHWQPSFTAKCGRYFQTTLLVFRILL